VTNEITPMILKSIGIVRNKIKKSPDVGYSWDKAVSEVVIDESLTDALDGLEGFSHIIVIWWMHRAVSDKAPLKIHPKGNRRLPLVGRLVTRTPNRPNLIGKATVRLLQRRGNILKVEGLDAFDGTPVIDIKPYIPGYDSAAGARVPQWITSREARDY
jgi:tRNA-Thr(GGU) m(6)t(6)A37 methyltransferase TsaA